MKSKVVIRHVCSNRWHSAITEYAISAAESMRQDGLDCLLLLQSGSAAERAGRNSAVKVCAIRNFHISLVLRVIAALVRRERSLWICYGGPESTTLKLLGVRFARVCGDAPRGLHTKVATARKFDSLIFPSKALQNKWQELVDGPQHVIAIARDERRYRYHSCAERREILIFGRLDPIKGHQNAIEVFGDALKDDSFRSLKPVLRITGLPKNTTIESLRILGEKSGLEWGENFIVDPRLVSNLAELMSSAAMGWIPSIGSEWICRVAEEFLLCGTPVLVSGVGALDEAIVDESAGWSYRCLDRSATSSLLVRAFQQSFNESDEVRTKRSAIASERFGVKRMAAQLRAATKPLSGL